MKKRLVVVFILVMIVLPLFSRPQFFFGGGLGWGKFYPGENEKVVLGENPRYVCRGEGAYIPDFIPYFEATYLPIADLGLGIAGSVGYGRSMIFYDGVTSRSGYGYEFGFRTDGILDTSLGLRYMTVMAKERYVSINAFLLYNFRRYSLSSLRAYDAFGKKDISDTITNLNTHSLSMGIGLMERYDGYYFRIDALVSKALDFSDGLNVFKNSGWRMGFSVTCGAVFTILTQNQFMR